MQNSPNMDDLHDKLVDHALREVSGGESPPDLSDQILSKVKMQADVACNFTTTPGDEAMKDKKLTNHRSNWGWLAIATSILIATGAILFMVSNLAINGTRQLTSAEVARLRQSGEMATKESMVPYSIRHIGPLPTASQSNGKDANLNSMSIQPSKIQPTPELKQRNKTINYYLESESLAQEERRLRANRIFIPQTNIGLDGLINDTYKGQGPDNSGDQYSRIDENKFQRISIDSTENRLSTFSIDVDTASYANVRQFLMKSNRLPPVDAVRIEELINYFDYHYTGPTDDVPFAANIEVAECPWQPAHRLVRVGIKGREIAREKRPLSNLVFLIDVSGSMNQPNKLPLLVQGMQMLTRELGENDRVAIVVYASSEGLALPSTPGDKQDIIRAALDKLRAGGSTAGGAGIALAYKTAQAHFIEGGVNRVILCTDGDFNVGVTSPAALERMAEKNANETGVFLTVLGFGRGNLNDAMMEKISGKGNGNYHYVDGLTEARKVLVEEMSGTLVTIAKDVKIQIEFNPEKVAGYRLIGYENRIMAAEDFNDDKKDAGEIGAGHTVTALYEIVPAGQPVDRPGVDALKYGQLDHGPLDHGQLAQSSSDEVVAPDEVDGEAIDHGTIDDVAINDGTGSGELLTLKIRYKRPDGDSSTKLEFPITDHGQQFGAASDDFKFASAVASFGMLLRDSAYRGTASYASVLEIAEDGCHHDPHEYRAEFLRIVRRAQQLAGK